MHPFTVSVESHAGHRGDEYPRRFQMGGRSLEVVEVLDRWISPQRRYFKLRADDGGIYILHHDEQAGWGLTLFDSGGREETRLSST